MEINTLRKIHLYLGCFFAPLLILFVVTGAWQTFELHEQGKSETSAPPAFVSYLSQIHVHQQLSRFGDKSPSFSFRIFTLLMCLGLLMTTTLGIIMAFKFTKNKSLVWLSLLGGFVVPLLLLWLSGSISVN